MVPCNLYRVVIDRFDKSEPSSETGYYDGAPEVPKSAVPGVLHTARRSSYLDIEGTKTRDLNKALYRFDKSIVGCDTHWRLL